MSHGLVSCVFGGTDKLKISTVVKTFFLIRFVGKYNVVFL